MLLSKFTQLNAITDIWEPHYSSNSVYIACWKINRSKLDIKLRFEKVNDYSEYAGDWFISKKKAKSFRKKMDNNGMSCYVIPWGAFDKLTLNERDWNAV